METKFKLGDFVVFNDEQFGRNYVGQVIEVRTTSIEFTNHKLRQPYYKIKPWMDTGLLFTGGDDVINVDDYPIDSLYQAVKRLAFGKDNGFFVREERLLPLLDLGDNKYEWEKPPPKEYDLESWDAT